MALLARNVLGRFGLPLARLGGRRVMALALHGGAGRSWRLASACGGAALQDAKHGEYREPRHDDGICPGRPSAVPGRGDERVNHQGQPRSGDQGARQVRPARRPRCRVRPEGAWPPLSRRTRRQGRLPRTPAASPGRQGSSRAGPGPGSGRRWRRSPTKRSTRPSLDRVPPPGTAAEPARAPAGSSPRRTVPGRSAPRRASRGCPTASTPRMRRRTRQHQQMNTRLCPSRSPSRAPLIRPTVRARV